MIPFHALPGPMQASTHSLKRTGCWGTEGITLYIDPLFGDDATGSQCVLNLLL